MYPAFKNDFALYLKLFEAVSAYLSIMFQRLLLVKCCVVVISESALSKIENHSVLTILKSALCGVTHITTHLMEDCN